MYLSNTIVYLTLVLIKECLAGRADNIQTFTGSHTSETVTVLAISRPSRFISLIFEISYSLHMIDCCAYLYVTRKTDGIGNCFNDTVIYNRNFFYATNQNSGKSQHMSYLDSCKSTSGTCKFTGVIKDQRYDIGRYYVMIGYRCGEVKPLNANYTFHIETRNASICQVAKSIPEMKNHECLPYLDQITFPNIQGDPLDFVLNDWLTLKLIASVVGCYQYSQSPEFLCQLMFRRCTNGLVYDTCYEMCMDMKRGCSTMLKFSNYAMDCSILLQRNESDCFYKEVNCGSPSSDDSGYYTYTSTNIGSEAQYLCKDGYEMKGTENTIQCPYSGRWPEPNVKCKRLLPVVNIALGSVFGGIILIVTVAMTIKYRLLIRILCLSLRMFCCKEEHQSRKDYDAFISYNSNTENRNRFVMDDMVQRLERQHPHFHLFLHYRNCEVGELIGSSLITGINNSNCLVALLDREYIKSHWCMFEFAQAQVRQTEKRDVKIIIVLMEPVREMGKIPEIIDAYIKATVYIERQDQLFWARLTHAIKNA